MKSILNAIFRTLIITGIITILTCGCGSKSVPMKDTDATSNTASTAIDGKDEIQRITQSSEATRYSLSAQRFSDIRAGSELIKDAIIDYSTYLKQDQDGYATEIRSILIQLSFYGDEVELNTISEYEASFHSIDTSVSPSLRSYKKGVIDAVDINTHVYNYLTASQDNIDYFFNGEEFNEVGDPYTGPLCHIHSDDYSFTLSFVKPGNEREEWVISKSSSAEDLPNNPILAGLVNIIETEFMSRFE